MSNRIHRLTASLAVAALVLTLSSPVHAVNDLSEVSEETTSVPMMFDVLVLRPAGLAATIVGAVFYVMPVAPLMAMTRPSDIGKPIEPLIGYPARFTFSDPIGQHP